MGGGISRLESTDWETADGKLDGESIQQTIDGTLPIGPKFGLYEIQKKTVGQREFDLVNNDLELIYTTKSVPGTVSWFDVLGPGSCGDYVDSKLRVTSDIARRTWIVYRYHLPLFEGQKPCSDPAVVKGLQEGVLLYRTACITVSWSRYIAVAARYGPPDLSDFLDVAVESADQTTNNDNGDDDAIIDDSDVIQSPHELQQQQQQQQKQQNEQTPSLQKEESFGDDPLFAQAQQIAERHRDHSEESPATATGTTASSSVVEEDGTSKNENEDVVNNTADDTNIEEDKAGDQVDDQDGDGGGGGGGKAEVTENVDDKSDDQQIQNNSTPSTDDDASNNNNTTSDDTDTTQIQASRSSVSQDSNDKSPTASQQLPTQQMRTSQSFGNSSRSSRMLPATTLTTSVKAAAAAAAASASASKTGSLSSSMMSGGGNSRRRLRDYFSSSKSSSLSLGAAASGSQDSDGIPEENEKEDEAERLKREAMELNLLYELALEGVIDLDTQPIMQCQEVYNKMIGNHQTFLMTKDEVIELLRMDEKQHEEQLEQQHATGETTNEDPNDAGINPMLQAVELDAKHKEQDSQQTTLSGSPPRSRWMSRWSSIRSSAASGAAASTGAVEVPSDTSSKPIEKVTEDASTADKLSSDSQTQRSGGGLGSGRRLRSSWNRMFSSSTTATAATAETTTIAEGSNEESTQSFEVPKEPPTAQPVAVLNRETLPSLMDESASSSNIDDTSNAMTSVAEDDESETVIETSRNTTDAVEGEEYPGSGVEESKEERSEATEDQNSTPTYDEKYGTEGEEMPKDESTQRQETEQEAEDKDEPPPPPLIGYFSWKHTTMNFAQHKMVLHLAKNSDLALHLVLSIIVNQVRSERNHTVFFTTGIHPTWVYPSSWKNPKEMIS